MDISKTTSLLLLLIVFAVLIQFIVERLKVVLGNEVSTSGCIGCIIRCFVCVYV